MKRTKIIFIIVLAIFSIQCQSNSGRESSESGRSVSNYASAHKAVRNISNGGKTISFTTSDNVVIEGTLYLAAQQPAPTVLCLHQWRNDRSSYNHLAEALQSEGMNVLTIDLRGYGGSQKKSDGSSVTPDRNTRKDIEAALIFLRAHKAVDKKRIGLLGASYGASNALIVSADDQQIKALVLLSPGLNYFNVLPTEPAIQKTGNRAVLAIASSEDMRSIEAVNRYKELVPSNIQIQIYNNAGHGTEMLRSASGLEELIVDFFKKNI